MFLANSAPSAKSGRAKLLTRRAQLSLYMKIYSMPRMLLKTLMGSTLEEGIWQPCTTVPREYSRSENQTKLQNDVYYYMDYQKATQILHNINEQGFEYFLSLDSEQLTELFECISHEDEKKILKYLEHRNHSPLPPTKPSFIESVKQIHKNIVFKQGVIEAPSNNLLQQLLKSSREKSVESSRHNYPYYEIVTRLLFVYGVTPTEDNTKMMHSQLHTMFKVIFKDNLLEGLHRRCHLKKENYLLPEPGSTNRIEYHEHSIAQQKDLKKYLAFIFNSEYEIFVDFKRNYKQIKKEAAEEFLSDEEGELSNDNDEKSNQNVYLEEVEPNQTDFDQQTEYLVLRTQNMNQKEFAEYASSRYLNFMNLGVEKLAKFVDGNSTGFTRLKNKQLFELISYILCKSLKSIIFQIIRMNNNGKLVRRESQKVTAEQIQTVGNEYIDRVLKRARTYALRDQTYLRKAYDKFIEEFFEFGYDQIFAPSKIKMTKSDLGETVLDRNDIAADVWKKHKPYRKAWFERILAEAQIEKYIEQNQKCTFKPLNHYAKFLYDNIHLVQQMKKSDLAQTFKQFFLGITTPIEKPKPPGSKLESLFD